MYIHGNNTKAQNCKSQKTWLNYNTKKTAYKDTNDQPLTDKTGHIWQQIKTVY
jgi:hypothetical protein